MAKNGNRPSLYYQWNKKIDKRWKIGRQIGWIIFRHWFQAKAAVKKSQLARKSTRLNAASRLSISPELLRRNSHPVPDFVFANAATRNANNSLRSLRQFTGRDENGTLTAMQRTIWDLFQIAVARIPSQDNAGFIVSGAPLFKTLLRNRTNSNDSSSEMEKRDESDSQLNLSSWNGTSDLDSPVKGPTDIPAMVLPMILSRINPPTTPTSTTPTVTTVKFL